MHTLKAMECKSIRTPSPQWVKGVHRHPSICASVTPDTHFPDHHQHSTASTIFSGVFHISAV